MLGNVQVQVNNASGSLFWSWFKRKLEGRHSILGFPILTHTQLLQDEDVFFIFGEQVDGKEEPGLKEGVF